MTTAFYSHTACHGHVTPEGHPERVARLHAVFDALGQPEFADLDRRQAPLVSIDSVERAHPQSYINMIATRAKEAGPSPSRIDEDTAICEGSWEAAMRAAGAVTSAVDAVMAGDIDNAFCAMRPPGHHAEPEDPMGFCLFNSIAIGALHAQAVHGLTRVAVVDFDVHHGNGTEAMFRDRPSCFFASSHQMPLYPGTGSPSDLPNILDVPLRPGTGSEEFRAAWTDEILPALEAFNPEFIFVSAGFDGHKQDPLAQLYLEDEDFGWVTRELTERAKSLCEGRLVSTLEGGYDLDALRTASAAHVGELMRA